ncbi:MAG: 3-keto-disaccharide hydrolase [Thermoguttaceae bacterium]
MSRPVRSSVLLALLAVAVSPAVARSAEGLNATQLSMVDDDFAFQGEYAGSVKDREGKEMKLGAQVIALGGGKFAAVVYVNGLPGAGWKREDSKAQLQGEKAGERVVLKGENISGEIAARKLVLKHAEHEGKAVLDAVERTSPSLGAKPPKGAMVIFDGSNTESFVEGSMNADGFLWAGATSKPLPESYSIHIEFILPYVPQERGQRRGNSGVYLHDCYELQVLDSFGLEGENNECGGFYKVRKPDVNMCLPPLTWQTYDINFTAPKFDGAGKKTASARVTVRHNGVVIHNDVELAETPGRQTEGPGPRGIHLQAHGNKVQYRNIWLVEKK